MPKNNFKMPTNKTAADSLLAQLEKQKTDLEAKLDNVARDRQKAREKIQKMKNHFEFLEKVQRETEAKLLQIQKQTETIHQNIPRLYNSRSAARRARLQLKAQANQKN